MVFLINKRVVSRTVTMFSLIINSISSQSSFVFLTGNLTKMRLRKPNQNAFKISFEMKHVLYYLYMKAFKDVY